MRTNRYMQIAVFGGTLLFFVLWQTAAAGPPEKPGNPGVPGLLAEISELNDIVATQQEDIDQQLARIEDLEDMLDQLQYFAPVPRTGSIRSNATGDDGDLLKGIVWPVPRFTDNEDGTVTDNLTGLIWLKDANCFEPKPWPEAVDLCNNLASGQCGLTDGSEIGDWRMSNIKELLSLISYRFYNPPLPNTVGTDKWVEGDPFTGVFGVQNHKSFASSTNYLNSPNQVWKVYFFDGRTGSTSFGDGTMVRVWPVRGGN